jgi:hypothetical protein
MKAKYIKDVFATDIRRTGILTFSVIDERENRSIGIGSGT